MSAPPPGNLLLDELLAWSETAPDQPMILKHPFLCGEVQSTPAVHELLQRAHGVLSVPPRSTLRFSGPEAQALAWWAEIDGRRLEGVTAALRRSGHLEVRVMLRSFPVTSLWRSKLREISPSPALAAWDLPAGTDVSIARPDADQTVEAHLPFPLAEGAVFHSPVLTRPVRGAALVERVIGNAAAVYGARQQGPNLTSGPDVLGLWTASVSGVPIEAAGLVHFDGDKRADSITVLMQPWPAVQLFRDRVRARVEQFLPDDYFELRGREQ